MNYRKDIDGLRCLAVLLVFVFHFEVISAGKSGFMGVDIFFVISGFLISSIIWGQLEEGRFSLRTFYLRRFRRLAPALVCVQFLLLALSYFFLLPRETLDLAAQSLSAQTYLINFYLWRKVGYFGLGADGVALLHCWSLAIEEQFYLLYPLLLIGIHRYARRHFVPILAALAAGSFLLNLYFVRIKPEATFYLLPTRAWELALGALIPFAQPWFEKRATWRQVVACVGTGLVVAGVALFHVGTAFPGSFALLPTLGTVALIFAGAGGQSWVSRLLSLRPAVYIGKISYSMYLVHWPIKVFMTDFLVDYTLGWRWASLALAMVLSVGLHHLVEDPLRKGKVWARPRQFVLAYAAGFTVVMVLVVSALVSNGWSYRFSPAVVKIADYAKDQDDSARACEYQVGRWPGPEGPCRIGVTGKPATWLVVGDSHAWALATSFSLFLKHRGDAGVLVFSHGCLPVSGLGGRICQAFNSDVGRWVEGNQTIHDVVLVSIWRQPIEGSLQGPDGRYLGDDAALETFQQQFAQTVKMLNDRGRNVYVWEPIPTAQKSVPITLARNLAFGLHLRIETNRQDHERTFAFMRAVLDANRNRIKGFISPVPTMCPSGTCLIEQGGAPLFFDNNHPALSRAPFYAEIIEEQLRSVN